jgi:uncharacterized membrane protein
VEDQGTVRLETFSDGIFAIAATLLVLEFSIASPLHESLGSALLHLWPSYLAYATSFLTIGIIWVNHHAIFQLIARADRRLLFMNTIFLMTVAFIPFPTRLVAEFLNKGSDERDAVLAYALTFTLMAITYSGLWLTAAFRRRLIAEPVPQERVTAVSRSFYPGWILYAIATGLAFASPVVTIAFMLALALFYVPSEWLFLRRLPEQPSRPEP